MENFSKIVVFLSFVSGFSQECSAPPEYPHTKLVSKFVGRQNFSSGEKVYYDCAEDFRPTKGLRAVQCVDGKWPKLSLKCEKKSCGNVGELPHGQLIYEGNSYIGERVYAVCNEGYTLKGGNNMICKKSGWTGEFPSCEEMGVACSAPAVAHAVQRGDAASVYQVGDEVNLTCSVGFQLDGAQQITCGADGRWQPKIPQCLPSADKEGRCGVPVTVNTSSIHLDDNYAAMTSFASGDKVRYTCGVGHVHAGGSRYRKCVNGKWAKLTLRCERKLCGSAGEIQYGQFVYTGVEFGDKATAVCNEGYRLVGKGTRNCMSTGWDGRVPDCEAVDCPEPHQVPNAEMRGAVEPPHLYGNVVYYRCLKGVVIGHRDIWCTKEGNWSAPPPVCKEITCQTPHVLNGYWMGARVEPYRYGDAVTFHCDPGYVLSGPRMITCGGDGQWSRYFPTCKSRPFYRFQR
ncbi:complement receptor type 1-like [Thalassophryne amazonica]|uniref:complement receptor type 1-like n=1 Tax=Thalassophryne amazonica TaxID=390379 RepID=UPI00147165DD|nr:complement receptor type 1-like [Thalassophryne amazonica]